MTNRYHLNLSTHPFPRYRTTNLLLTSVLALTLVFAGWQVVGFLGYMDRADELAAAERDARAEWNELGSRLAALEEQLRRPEAVAEMEEIRFLTQVIERKRFSWGVLLDVIERTIPRQVRLISLQPQIGESGRVRVAMEARGRTVEDLGRFIAALENTAAFRDVAVSVEERGVADGGSEIRVSMSADYMPELAMGREAR